MVQHQPTSRLSPAQWKRLNDANERLANQEESLRSAFDRYQRATVNKSQIMAHLEFLEDDMPYFDTFTVPSNSDNMQLVGKKNKSVDQFYLLDRWLRGGKDAGILKQQCPEDPGMIAVWEMSAESRREVQLQWKTDILEELVAELRQLGKAFNEQHSKIREVFAQRDAETLKNKRIIACTTNGAAKYSAAIQSTFPGVVLVEEAGEILEAHILTSLGLQTQQLIMIGDHKQLRPKCSYELGVEIGDGFDLNRSLFERLILKGFPHTTLTKQHRMRPEISATIRELIYPDLVDAPTTLDRPNLRGFKDNLIFFNHENLETELRQMADLKDDRSSSKQNEFEAKFILKCVRYIAQQGYGSDKIVVLTPYLGQLKMLKEHLAEDNDPVLNDLDTFDLVQAGLLPATRSRNGKPSLRISSIGKSCLILNKYLSSF
jgi:hypothetical protein